MTNEYKISKRLEEVLELKREIADEVENLPAKEAVRELMRKAAESRKAYPDLKESSPRRRSQQCSPKSPA
jgi:hypothetical protein